MSDPEDSELERAQGAIRRERRFVRLVALALIVVCGVSAYRPARAAVKNWAMPTAACEALRQELEAGANYEMWELFVEHPSKSPKWTRAAIGRVGTVVEDDTWLEFGGEWRHVNRRCGGGSG